MIRAGCGWVSVLCAVGGCGSAGQSISNEGTQTSPVEIPVDQTYVGMVKKQGQSFYRFTAPHSGEYSVTFRIVDDDLVVRRNTAVNLFWKIPSDTGTMTPYFSYGSAGGNLLWPDGETLLFYIYNGGKNLTKGQAVDVSVQSLAAFTTIDGNDLVSKDTRFELTVAFDPRSEGSTADPVRLSIGETYQATVLYWSHYAFEGTALKHQIVFSTNPTNDVSCVGQPAKYTDEEMFNATVLPQPTSTSTVSLDAIGDTYTIRCGAFGFNSFEPDRQMPFTLSIL
jgi:hypothetical protein